MLERGGRRATAPFGALVYEPSNNIWAHPGDTIYLYREPQTFLAFGAMAPRGDRFFRPEDKAISSLVRGDFRSRKVSARPADWISLWPNLPPYSCIEARPANWRSVSASTARAFRDRSFPLSTT
jgi:hypothetical protein